MYTDYIFVFLNIFSISVECIYPNKFVLILQITRCEIVIYEKNLVHNILCHTLTLCAYKQ